MRTPRIVQGLRQIRTQQLERRAFMTGLDRRRQRARCVRRSRRWGMWAVIVVGAALLLAGLPWLLMEGPYKIDGEYINQKELARGSAALVTGLRTSVVAFAAALGAGIALLYTARTYRLTRRGQITDRFTKALERLGSSQIYVRIGGILALEQIVQDAPEQAATDAAHVLGHFIRDRAPKTAPPPDPDDPHRGPHADPRPSEPAADVQAALTALTRSESRTHVDPREQLDLHGLHLAGAHLAQADLTGADLYEATLTGAHLDRATFTRADLYGATFTEAHLYGATFTEAHLYGATFTEARLSEATFTGADLDEATFTEAHLYGATFTEARLSEATFTGARLYEATFTEADLSGATFTGAHLSGATFTRADLSGATFTRADLSGADLSSARGLTPGQATSATTDEDTKMPARFYALVGVPEAS
ncbi:pentapeptide repeat-containing protein [Streptomyces phaeochromogenes]|uniref:pentapeptide repeat-containing protein n=1 Tax=Streptomyces phaeochromogenes TaxID=1923 RepID=UPI003714582D